jgi:hypothetical protein
MTGNVALDVAIGLVFIYTLYSLLTTTIVEFIATSFQLRAKNLKYAIARMLDDDNKPLMAHLFNETPIIKYLASKRFASFFRVNAYPSYMTSESFVQAFMYMCKKGNESETNPGNVIKGFLEKFKGTETGDYLNFLFNEVNGDIEKFKKLLEKWFDTTMERSTGWYKKNLTFITFGFGLLIAMLFNIDSFKIVQSLSKDPKAREQYVQMAAQALNNPVFTNPSPTIDTTLRKRLLSDSDLFKRLGKDSAAFRKAMNDSVYQQVSHTQKELIARMDTLYKMSEHAQSILSFKRLRCPLWFFDDWANFLGCLVTAIALSLGSPFWFDLLNKLMKLRSSIAITSASESKQKKDSWEEVTPNAVG